MLHVDWGDPRSAPAEDVEHRFGGDVALAGVRVGRPLPGRPAKVVRECGARRVRQHPNAHRDRRSGCGVRHASTSSVAINSPIEHPSNPTAGFGLFHSHDPQNDVVNPTSSAVSRATTDLVVPMYASAIRR